MAVADDTVTVKVVGPDGKPAGGVAVWVYDWQFQRVRVTTEPSWFSGRTDSSGEVRVPYRNALPMRGSHVLARDAAGRVGSADFRFHGRNEATASTIRVRLFDVVDRAGRVVDAAGKPIAGAAVRVISAHEPYNPESHTTQHRIWPPKELGWWMTVTDADGRFALKRVPAGHQLSFTIQPKGAGEFEYFIGSDGELSVTHLQPGRVRVAANGVELTKLGNVSVTIRSAESPGPKPTPGVNPSRNYWGVFDGKAELTIPDVAPGRYRLELHQTLNSPALPRPVARSR